jgi:hypothetical protein
MLQKKHSFFKRLTWTRQNSHACKVPCMIFILSVDMTYHLVFHSVSMACREIVLKMTCPRRKTFLTNIGIAHNWPCQIIGLATQMNISVIQRAQASRYSREQSKTVWPARSNQNSLQITGNNKDGYIRRWIVESRQQQFSNAATRQRTPLSYGHEARAWQVLLLLTFYPSLW